MTDVFGLVSDVWAAAEEPLSRHIEPLDFERLRAAMTDAERRATPRIVVFGTYNAGKSTLINALVGREVAAMADKPETDKVTPYPWRGYTLDDTPGIDAPIEHEKVTRAHLEGADAVLFVIASDGVLEEQLTIDEIAALMRGRVPLRIIVNNKSGFAPYGADYEELREALEEKIRDRMEEDGAGSGVANVRLVNAASALRGRLEGKPLLESHSGLIDLESDLEELCASTGKAQIARTLGRQLAKQLDLALASMPPDAENARHAADLERLATERARVEIALDQTIKRIAVQFQSSVRAAMAPDHRANVGNIEANSWLAAAEAIQLELNRSGREIQAMDLPLAERGDLARPSPNLTDGLPKSEHHDKPGATASFSWGDLVKVASDGAGRLGREQIADGFMAAKQAFPGAFKGLGPKFFGRVAPFVGSGIAVAAGAFEVGQTIRNERRRDAADDRSRRDQDQAIRAIADRLAFEGHRFCAEEIENAFKSAEAELSRRTAALREQTIQLETDRTMLLRGHRRLNVDCE